MTYPTGWGIPQVKTAPLYEPPRDVVRRQADLYRHSVHPRYPMLVSSVWHNDGFYAGLLNDVDLFLNRGAAFNRKIRIFQKVAVVAEINKRNPALAAEQRQRGEKAARTPMDRDALRRWKDINWAFLMGRGYRKTYFASTYGMAAESFGWG